VGVCAALIAVALGICIGGPAGYFGAQLDNLLMRATDAVMVLPTFFLVLIVVAIFGGSIWKLIALIGITNWPPVARLVRAEFLSLRERDFALAAKAVGAGHVMIMLRHILPNALPVIIPTLSLKRSADIQNQEDILVYDLAFSDMFVENRGVSGPFPIPSLDRYLLFYKTKQLQTGDREAAGTCLAIERYIGQVWVLIVAGCAN